MTVHSEQVPFCMSLRMYRGDDFGFTVVVTEGGVPADLTGVEVLAQVRATPGSPEVAATFAYSIVENTIILSLSPDEVADVPDRSRWDCELLYPDNRIRTVAYGPVRVVEDVSHV